MKNIEKSFWFPLFATQASVQCVAFVATCYLSARISLVNFKVLFLFGSKKKVFSNLFFSGRWMAYACNIIQIAAFSDLWKFSSEILCARFNWVYGLGSQQWWNVDVQKYYFKSKHVHIIHTQKREENHVEMCNFIFYLPRIVH